MPKILRALALLLATGTAWAQTYPWTPTPLPGTFYFINLPSNELVLGTPAQTVDMGTVYWNGTTWQSSIVTTGLQPIGANEVLCNLNNTAQIPVGCTQLPPGFTITTINGTSVPMNTLANQILVTTASATAAWETIPNCNATNDALQYNTTNQQITCVTISSSGGVTIPASAQLLNSGTGTNPPVGSVSLGTNLSLTGTFPSQTLNAASTASTNWNALVPGVNTNATGEFVIGTGASLGTNGTAGSIQATLFQPNALVVSGTGPSAANSWMYMTAPVSGTYTSIGASPPRADQIYANYQDTINCPNGGDICGFLAANENLNTGWNGTRGSEFEITINAPPVSGNTQNVNALLTKVNMNSDMLGVYGEHSLSNGNIFGFNPNIFANSAIHAYTLTTTSEFDVQLPFGSTSYEKHGMNIATRAADAAQGVISDEALVFANGNYPASAWQCGICFAQVEHDSPFTFSSTYLGANYRYFASNYAPEVGWGVDFHQAQIYPGLVPTAATGTGTTATLTFSSTVAASSPSGNGTTATVLIAPQVVPPAVGSPLTIAGQTGAGYNGSFTITASTYNSVSYANTTTANCGTNCAVGTATFNAPVVPPVGSTIIVQNMKPAAYDTPASGAIVTGATATTISYASTGTGTLTQAGNIWSPTTSGAFVKSKGYQVDFQGNEYANSVNLNQGSLNGITGSLQSLTIVPYGGYTGGAYSPGAFPTITIDPPPNAFANVTGSTATASVTSMGLTAAILTAVGGVGCTAGTYSLSSGGGSVTVTTAGGVVQTAVAAATGNYPTTTAGVTLTVGGCSVQPPIDLKFNVLTTSINNAGSLYHCGAPPFVYASNSSNDSNTPAMYQAQMACATAPIILNAGNQAAPSWGTGGITLGTGGTQLLQDTSSTTGGGTVATQAAAALPTYAFDALNPATYTNLAALYVPAPVTATGTNIATTAAAGTGATATITVATQPVAPVVGESVTIAGVTPTGYNGTYTITGSSTSTISYANTTTGAQTVAGTATWGNVTSTNVWGVFTSGSIKANGAVNAGALSTYSAGVTVTGGNVILNNSGTTTSSMGTGTNTGTNTIGNGSGGSTLISSVTLKFPNIASNTGAQTGYLCYSSTAGLLTYDPTNTCLVSASRFKHAIEPLDAGLATLLKLTPRQFFYNNDGSPRDAADANFTSQQIGFISEEVRMVEPRLATVEPDGQAHGVRYEQMTALLVKALQEEHNRGNDTHWRVEQQLADKQFQVSTQARTLDRQQWEIYALAVWCAGLTVAFVIRRRRVD